MTRTTDQRIAALRASIARLRSQHRSAAFQEIELIRLVRRKIAKECRDERKQRKAS